jgi:hypothetical protein
MASLELSKSADVAAHEGARYFRRCCEPLGSRLFGVNSVAIRSDGLVEHADELLIRVVALASRRDSAEHPDGHRERESQEQQPGGEPQPATGIARYFLPPLCPLPPPWSVGGVAAFGGGAGWAFGAFLAWPGGAPW